MSKFLSISILSSGRIETIERCLSSLAPLKEAFDTEIIITDTDSTHRKDVRLILEKYADTILNFDWCDDFSAARNVGIKAASGKWFMFIDDDEWIEDASALIDFLSSERSDNYHILNIKVRNFSNSDFSEYTDSWVTRVIRRFDNTHFSGRVHEYFTPITGGYTAVNALLGHSGYVYETTSARNEHANRNIKLLEKSISDDPNEIRWWEQLLQEYDYTDNFEKQFEICDMLLKKFETGVVLDDDNTHCLCIAAKIRLYRKLERWDEERDFYESHYKSTNFTEVCEAYVNIDMALCYLNLDDYENSVSHLQAYFDAYEKWHNRKDELSLDLKYFLNETFDENIFDLALAIDSTWQHRLAQNKPSVENEMRQLAKQLIIKANELRAAGYEDEADAVLNQLKAVTPPEIIDSIL